MALRCCSDNSRRSVPIAPNGLIMSELSGIGDHVMGNEEFRLLLEHGDVEGVRSALALEPELANRTIDWHLNQDNKSDPLHYICDCVGNGWLTNGSEGKLAELLLAHSAEINGTEGRE